MGELKLLETIVKNEREFSLIEREFSLMKRERVVYRYMPRVPR